MTIIVRHLPNGTEWTLDDGARLRVSGAERTRFGIGKAFVEVFPPGSDTRSYGNPVNFSDDRAIYASSEAISSYNGGDGAYWRRKLTSVKETLTDVAGGEPWGIPVPFGVTRGPDFPLRVFPDIVEDFVDAVAHTYQVPRTFAAVVVMGVVSASINKKCRVFVNDSWTVGLNEFFLTAMESGERKSAVHSELYEPLRARERELFRESERRIAESETENNILEQRVKELQSRAAKAKAGEATQAMNEAKQAASDLSALHVERHPRLLASDFTVEALAILLRDQGGKIAIESAEGGMFSILAGRYSGVPSFDLLAQGYSGDHVVIDRKNNGGAIVIPDPSITFCVAVQPHIIKGLGETPSFRAQGLLARIKFVFPETMVGHRLIDPAPIPTALRGQYSTLVANVLSLPDSNEGQRHIRLSDEAHNLFRHFCHQSEADLKDGGEYEYFKDWGSRLPSTVLKSAGLLHVMEYGLSNHEPWNTPISYQTMESAIAIGDFYAEHAAVAFGMVGSDERTRDAEKVWEAIKRNEMTDFSERDIWRIVRRQFDNKTDLNETLSLLVDTGYIMPKQAAYSGTGRKPTQNYESNPNVIGIGDRSDRTMDEVSGA